MEMPKELQDIYNELLKKRGKTWREQREFMRFVCPFGEIQDLEMEWAKLEILEEMANA